MTKDCIIQYGDSVYYLDKLTSYRHIVCKQDVEKSRTSNIIAYWTKEFHFGGDVLDLRSTFNIPISIPIPKKHWYSSGTTLNPAWDFWLNHFPTFEEYKKEFGEEKTWIDYCVYVAEKTNSVDNFNHVKKNAEFVFKRLEKIENERYQG